MTKTQIQFPDPLYKRLKAIAARNDWSLAEVVRRATELYAGRFPEDLDAGADWQFPTLDDAGDFLCDPASTRPENDAISERSGSVLSADTNLSLYAANPSSAHHAAARNFFDRIESGQVPFATCELVLVEIFMQLRNPALLARPMSAQSASTFCLQLRNHPRWQHVDYEPGVSQALWDWASETTTGFRQVIDARLALTLRHHGITEFATANTKDFKEFGFERVWNPLVNDS